MATSVRLNVYECVEEVADTNVEKVEDTFLRCTEIAHMSPLFLLNFLHKYSKNGAIKIV